ncbi:membrane metallo-endopeptidase-like 1 [Drosophila subpulchrella]|uniref:membrane metallo-endopeptidase-like 1 n=1 Tax=Drosophila subpulchrella TaxID=1486046 RepID=UPI0018A1774B|nr:membrane metallo-endopeptidase-like 1 [Drosophila subpulchrella]
MKWIIFLWFVSIVSASRLPNGELDSNTRLLNNIFNSQNNQANVCTNYARHACGNYARAHFNDPFPNMDQMLNHKMNKKLIQLMEELDQSSQTPDFNETSVEAKVLRFYRNCREAPPETRKIEHYLKLVPPSERLSWPPLTPPNTSWNKDHFMWMETLAHLHWYGLTNVLINTRISYNWQNSAEALLILDSSFPGIHLGKAQRVLRTLRVPSEKIHNLLRKFKRLDTDVQNLSEQYNLRRQIMSVDRLNSATGYDWQRFIEIIVGTQIQPNFRVEVKNLAYLTGLTRLLDSYDAELVAYYLMSQLAIFLQTDTMGGEDPLYCIQDVRRNMYVASNLLYKERFLKTLPIYTREVEEVFDEIRYQLLRKIERNRLGLNAEQKKMISRKVQNTVLNIGNMPKGQDHRSFADHHYEGLDIPSTDLDFAREHIKMIKFRTGKEHGPLHLPALNSEDGFHMPNYYATSIGPYNHRIANVIILPYAYLQEPIIVPDSHDVFKFSLLGFVLGHELMHAVDSNNIVYDGHGNINEIGFGIGKLPRFEEGLECMHISSDKLSERMADIGGLELAHSAYFKSTKIRNPIDFTNELSAEHIFFLNMAQFFCSDGFPEYDAEHDPDMMRLSLVLMGAAPFHQAFGCHRYEPPCQLW